MAHVHWVQHCSHCRRSQWEEDTTFFEGPFPAEVVVSKNLCGELMSPAATCLDSELEASEAEALLETSGLTSAPVTDDNHVLIGVVSTVRLARTRLASSSPYGEAETPEVEDVMSTDVPTLRELDSIGDAARVMASYDLDRVPVVTEDGHVLGVICAMDLVRWLSTRVP